MKIKLKSEFYIVGLIGRTKVES